jgi:DNA repair exonuclease SbcCD ATPase subunit
MLNFDRLELEDTDVFKNAVFKFKPGLQVIYGLNRTTRKSVSGNATGKSYLLSQIPEILFDDPVIGEKEDRSRTGRRSLFLTWDDRQYEFQRRGTKLQVLHNDKPVARTNKELKQWLTQLPTTLDEFGAFGYIDSRRHHPLVMGTSTERKKFLSDFFKLGKIDAERKLIKAQLDRLKETKAQHDELEREYAVTRNMVKGKAKTKDLRERLEKLQRRLSSLQARAEQEMHRRRVLDFVESVEPQLRIIKKRTLSIKKLTSKKFRTAHEDARSSLETNEKLLKDAREYELFLKTSNHYHNALAKLSEETVAQLKKYGPDEIKKQSKSYIENRDKVKLLQEEEAPVRPKKIEKPEQSVGELVTRQSTLRHQLDHAEKFGAGKCPTCGQDVKVKDPSKLRKELKSVDKNLRQAEAYEQFHRDWKQYKKQLKDYEWNQELLNIHSAALKKQKKWYTSYKELRDLPSPPSQFTGKKVEVSVVQRMVDEDREVLNAFDIVAPNLKMVLEFASMESYDDTSDFMSKVEALTPKVAQVQADLEVARTYRKRLKSMKTRLESLRKDLLDVPALKLLMEAYADKAMKRMAIKAISSRLMKQVNKYASKIFTENYRFELNWDSSNLKILAHRRYGKKTKTSDVRKLSGAEYRIFTNIVVMSLLTFVPPSRRLSLIVLDEPASNMHPETQEQFRQLLKVMVNVIPTVVVITPMTNELYEDAECYTVVKRNGDSTIVKGHPSKIKD